MEDLFSEVQRVVNSEVKNHKHCLAVLEAVTAVIRALSLFTLLPEDGGDEPNATSYFAALMASLSESASQNNEFKSSTLYLLSIVFSKIDPAILQSKFVGIVATFQQILEQSQLPSFLKPILTCLSYAILAQTAPSAKSKVLGIFGTLLQFCADPRPKLRRVAQTAVTRVLNGETVFKKQFSRAVFRVASSVFQPQSALQEVTRTLHCLNLLKEALPALDSQVANDTTHLLLALPSLGHETITLVAFVCMENLVSNAFTTIQADHLSAWLDALLGMDPGQSTELGGAYGKLLRKALERLYELNPANARYRLPRAANFYIASLRYSGRKDLANQSTSHLKTLVQLVVDNEMVQMATNNNNLGDMKADASLLEQIVESLQDSLSFSFNETWDLVLDVLGSVFTAATGHAQPLLDQVLSTLASFYESDEFPFRKELTKTLTLAVTSYGAKAFLSVLPLHIGNNEAMRAWLLPIMKNGIRNEKLAFFGQYFLPLSRKVIERINTTQSPLEKKVYETIYLQLWDLFPSFCRLPTDLADNFKFMARPLGELLESPETALQVQQDIVVGLRLLIAENKTRSQQQDAPAGEVTPAQAVANLQSMAAFSEAYLKILFNLYDFATDNATSVLATLQLYVSISPQPVLDAFFAEVMSKFRESVRQSHESVDLQHLAELALAFISFLKKKKHVSGLFKLAVTHLPSKALQKKCYQILSQICEFHKPFALAHLDALLKTLTQSQEQCQTFSKKSRLRCLRLAALLIEDQQKQFEFVPMLLPEVVLACKDVNKRTRDLAFDLLIDLAEHLKNSANAERNGLQEFVQMTVGGLAGQPHMISATLLALARLVFEFSRDLEEEFIGQLLETVFTLFASRTREVQKSLLSLVKVVLSSVPLPLIKPLLPNLVNGLASWGAEGKNRFRSIIRIIFSRLMRKFGSDTIWELTPEPAQKILHAIQKTVQKENKQKEKKREERAKGRHSAFAKTAGEDDEDSDSEDETPAEKKLSQKAKRKNNRDRSPVRVKAAGKDFKKETGKTRKEKEPAQKHWIVEGEEPLDLLSSRAGAIVSVNPAKKKKVTKHQFKSVEGGKLLFHDEDDKTRKREEELAKAKADAEQNYIEAHAGLAKKRKDSLLFDHDSDDEKKKPKKSFGAKGKAKGRGDFSKKGQLDPYAYVKLDANMLNKRKQKGGGQFNSIVRGVNRGAQQAKGKKRR